MKEVGWILIRCVVNPFDDLAFLNLQIAWLKNVLFKSDASIHLRDLSIVNISILLTHHIGALENSRHLLVINYGVLFSKVTFLAGLLPTVTAFLHGGCPLLTANDPSLSEKVRWLPILQLGLAWVLFHLIHECWLDSWMSPYLLFGGLKWFLTELVIPLVPTFLNLLELDLLTLLPALDFLFRTGVEPKEVREFGLGNRFGLRGYPIALLQVVYRFQESLRWCLLGLLGIIWLLREPGRIIHIFKTYEILKYKNIGTHF